MNQQLRRAKKYVYKHHSQKVVQQNKNVRIVSATAIHLDIFYLKHFYIKKRTNYSLFTQKIHI